MYTDSERRYREDAEFHAAVDMMRHMGEKHGFTPGELKQIAFYAAFLIEMYRAPPKICYVCHLPAGSPACRAQHQQDNPFK